MGPQSSTAEARIAEIARRQHGLAARTQLLSAGVTAVQVKRRLEKGSLHRVHRGVYRVGHRAPSLEAHYLAAVLACGEGAVLSGHAAAYLFGLLKGRPPRPEVTAPTDRRVPGVTTHRSHLVTLAERATHRGIPMTTIPRTLAALAPKLSPTELAYAVHEAIVRHHLRPEQVETVLARTPNTPGAAQLRAVLCGDTPVALSKLESAFLALLRRDGLPQPRTNQLAGGRRVDCRWPEAGLTVELDGYRYHRSRHAWELDRRREREARARGDEFRRYTYGDVVEQPDLMLAELRELLSAG